MEVGNILNTNVVIVVLSMAKKAGIKLDKPMLQLLEQFEKEQHYFSLDVRYVLM